MKANLDQRYHVCLANPEYIPVLQIFMRFVCLCLPPRITLADSQLDRKE